MDGKVTDFDQLTGILPTDILYVIRGGTDNFVNIGTLSLNLPNIGNSGITKNTILTASNAAIPLTSTVVFLPGLQSPYVLQNGSNGQEITLISGGSNTVNFSSGVATMGNKCTATFIFVSSLQEWVVKSQYGTNFA